MLGKNAFQMSELAGIRLPSGLRRLEQMTFWYCKNLKRVELPDCLEYIGRECFQYCPIEKLTLPGTLREVGRDAFSGCGRLEVVHVERGCALDVESFVGPSVKVWRK